MAATRRPAVAGTWYPGRAPELARAVDAFVDAAAPEPLPRPCAVVSPHAGLRYSGPVAAYAYGIARQHPFSTAILVGPSHFVSFRGVSIWPRGEWDTPFGPVAVDEPLAADLAAACPAIVDRPDAHAREHSIEMQLPFLARLLSGVRIVPLVMGRQDRETALGLGDALARVVAARTRTPSAPPGTAAPEPTRHRASADGDGGVLLVASSDLSHYEPAHVAAALDAVVIRHVEALDAGGLMAALEAEPRHACGGGPMVAVLHAARALGATRARTLRYADSGDVSGDKASVVGYLAAAVW